jgi:hypothetical protein
MDLGFQLAIQVLTVYCLLGPFVFLGVYIFFDRLAEREPDMMVKKEVTPVHPDLWSPKDIDNYLNKRSFFDRITDRTEP